MGWIVFMHPSKAPEIVLQIKKEQLTSGKRKRCLKVILNAEIWFICSIQRRLKGTTAL